jgi:hypothetical protein
MERALQEALERNRERLDAQRAEVQAGERNPACGSHFWSCRTEAAKLFAASDIDDRD